ncbi:hypothetical protein KR222_004371 [Zaprionus bogoriensis]|nr:hypothetical protein KR222_004371 [Zaprionus bogoriensis]
MSSKFWVFVTLVSVALAHTYVYTDSIKSSEDLANYDVLIRLKNELRWAVKWAQGWSEEARQGIADFRRRIEEWQLERGKKVAHEFTCN